MEENVPTMLPILVMNKATSELKEAETMKTPLWINLRENNLKIWTVHLYIWELFKKILLFIYRKFNDILKNIEKFFFVESKMWLQNGEQKLWNITVMFLFLPFCWKYFVSLYKESLL